MNLQKLILIMSLPRKQFRTTILYCCVLTFLLSSCVHPPYNNFKPKRPVARGAAIGGIMGTAVGGATTGTIAGALVGGVAGGAAGAILSTGTNPKNRLITALKKCSIQFVQYGDTMTLIIPTDKYFMFASPRLNELMYPGLENIIALLSLYPDKPIYVAGFTDNVGSRSHKNKLSEAQAETMMTYLWANGVKSQRLKVEGYGEKNSVGDNELIHGSAFNRRIEIQWFSGREPQKCCIAPAKTNYAMK